MQREQAACPIGARGPLQRYHDCLPRGGGLRDGGGERRQLRLFPHGTVQPPCGSEGESAPLFGQVQQAGPSVRAQSRAGFGRVSQNSSLVQGAKEIATGGKNRADGANLDGSGGRGTRLGNAPGGQQEDGGGARRHRNDSGDQSGGQPGHYPESDQPGDDQQPGARLLAGHIWHSEPPEPWVLSACPFPTRLTPAGPQCSLASGEAGRHRVPATPQIGRGKLEIDLNERREPSKIVVPSTHKPRVLIHIAKEE